MLGGLLSKEDCARCRQCCAFESYSLWDTPLITPGLKAEILSLRPQQEFLSREGCFLLKMQREPEGDLYLCPMLDRSRGCILGDKKPFDCRIFPFRVMLLGDRRVIALSPECPVAAGRPIAVIAERGRELEDEIFAEADRHPEFVKPYQRGFIVLAAEERR